MAQAAVKPKPDATDDSDVVAKKTLKVTYTPLEQGDPHTTTVAGIAFRANVPVEIALDRPVLQLVRREKETAEGEIRTQSVEAKVRVIDLFKGNPWFRVEGFDQPKRKAGAARGPTSVADYKSFALRWIAAAENVGDLETRWANEDGLRTACGVGPDDEAVILMFLEAQKDVLAAGGFKH